MFAVDATFVLSERDVTESIPSKARALFTSSILDVAIIYLEKGTPPSGEVPSFLIHHV
jgi:hypothetical protein